MRSWVLAVDATRLARRRRDFKLRSRPGPSATLIEFPLEMPVAECVDKFPTISGGVAECSATDYIRTVSDVVQNGARFLDLDWRSI